MYSKICNRRNYYFSHTTWNFLLHLQFYVVSCLQLSETYRQFTPYIMKCKLNKVYVLLVVVTRNFKCQARFSTLILNKIKSVSRDMVAVGIVIEVLL